MHSYFTKSSIPQSVCIPMRLLFSMLVAYLVITRWFSLTLFFVWCYTITHARCKSNLPSIWWHTHAFQWCHAYMYNICFTKLHMFLYIWQKKPNLWASCFHTCVLYQQYACSFGSILLYTHDFLQSTSKKFTDVLYHWFTKKNPL